MKQQSYMLWTNLLKDLRRVEESYASRGHRRKWGIESTLTRSSRLVRRTRKNGKTFGIYTDVTFLTVTCKLFIRKGFNLGLSRNLLKSQTFTRVAPPIYYFTLLLVTSYKGY